MPKQPAERSADKLGSNALEELLIRPRLLAFRGTPLTPLDHFSPWNVDDDGVPVPEGFLQLTRNFTAFDEGSDGRPMETIHVPPGGVARCCATR